MIGAVFGEGWHAAVFPRFSNMCMGRLRSNCVWARLLESVEREVISGRTGMIGMGGRPSRCCRRRLSVVKVAVWHSG
jgi:hypothetical protein